MTCPQVGRRTIVRNATNTAPTIQLEPREQQRGCIEFRGRLGLSVRRDIGGDSVQGKVDLGGEVGWRQASRRLTKPARENDAVNPSPGIVRALTELYDCDPEKIVPHRRISVTADQGEQTNMGINAPLNRKLRMALVGGGQGAFIGRVHATAAVLDNRAALVAGRSCQRSRREPRPRPPTTTFPATRLRLVSAR